MDTYSGTSSSKYYLKLNMTTTNVSFMNVAIKKCLCEHISLYFIEWRDGLVTIPAVISVKKVFAILKGGDHDSTGWCHLDESWCKASE
jgi:hypothetical protein